MTRARIACIAAGAAVVATAAASVRSLDSVRGSPLRPWQPTVAHPSGLLDAVGAAPPRLAAPNCTPSAGLAYPSRSFAPPDRRLEAALALGIRRARWAVGRAVRGPWTTCRVGGPASSEQWPEGTTWIEVDPSGRVVYASRHWQAPDAGAVRRVVDSVLARAARRPATRVLGCPVSGFAAMPRPDGRSWPAIPPHTLRAFEGDGYQAIVHVDSGDVLGRRVYGVRVEASASGFSVCMRGRPQSPNVLPQARADRTRRS